MVGADTFIAVRNTGAGTEEEGAVVLLMEVEVSRGWCWGTVIEVGGMVSGDLV